VPGREYSDGAAGIYVHRNENEVVSNGEFIADTPP